MLQLEMWYKYTVPTYVPTGLSGQMEVVVASKHHCIEDAFPHVVCLRPFQTLNALKDEDA